MRDTTQTRDESRRASAALEKRSATEQPHVDRSQRATRLERAKFVLAVVGEFSSGKSFLLNALLGKFRYEDIAGGKHVVGLLATDINPSTATITELEYGR